MQKCQRDVRVADGREGVKKTLEMMVCSTPSAKTERLGLRKRKGLAHMFTGHQEWEQSQSGPSKALFSLTLSAFLTLRRHRSWAEAGGCCYFRLGSGNVKAARFQRGGIQAPFQGAALISGKDCPDYPVLLCPTPPLHCPKHWPLFYLSPCLLARSSGCFKKTHRAWPFCSLGQVLTGFPWSMDPCRWRADCYFPVHF